MSVAILAQALLALSVVDPSGLWMDGLAADLALVAGKWRKPRAKTSFFCEAKLIEEWGPLCALRDIGFPWDGSGYPSPKRGLAISRPHLILHYAALRLLLRISPTGFPSYGKLCFVITSLHSTYKILGVGEQCSDVPRQAGLAADRWRIMTKDVYRIAVDLKNRKRECHEIESLIACLELTESSVPQPLPSCAFGDLSGRPATTCVS